MSIATTSNGYLINGKEITVDEAYELRLFLLRQECVNNLRAYIDDKHQRGAYDSLPFGLIDNMLALCVKRITEGERNINICDEVCEEFESSIFDQIHPSVNLEELFLYLTNGEDVNCVKTEYGEIRRNRANDEYGFYKNGVCVCMNMERIDEVGQDEDGIDLHSVEEDDDVTFRLSVDEHNIAVEKEWE